VLLFSYSTVIFSLTNNDKYIKNKAASVLVFVENYFYRYLHLINKKWNFSSEG